MTENRPLPVIPLRGLIVYPMTVVNLDVGRKASLAATEAALKDNSLLLLVSQKDPNLDQPQAKDLFSVGTVAKIKQSIHLPGGAVRVLVEGVYRARINKVTDGDSYFEALITPLHEDEIDDHNQLEALVRTVSEAFSTYADLSGRYSNETLVTLAGVKGPERLVDVMASHLPIDLDKKQELLETSSTSVRLEKLSAYLYQEINILEIEKQIKQRVRKQMEKTQKEYYLREQMKAIQQELGQRDQRVQEVENYRQQLAKLKVDSEIKEKLTKEIDRLATIPVTSAEGSVIANYLDWCFSVPWDKETSDLHDLEQAQMILDEDHYGLSKVKERIIEYLAVRELTEATKGPILCLVGPPGVGKTSLARSVARALGRKFVKASLGGVRDEAEIRGHRRTYIGAMPGRIIQSLKQARAKNPVFLLDEIDKMSADFRGDPASALLEVLDPEQNSIFRDHYVEMPFDLSKVLFLTTANATHRIPRPLLDRMETIYLPGYTEDEKLEIALGYLLPKQLEQHGLTTEQLQLSENAIRIIINEYTREAGVRNLERNLAALCRKVARKVVGGKQTATRITVQNLDKYLGTAKYRYNKMAKQDEVGVATALAWTEVGGDTMSVEVSYSPGKGKLVLTGQLGDVMKESARAALSYVRSRSEQYRIDGQLYDKIDIHIHIPKGAIPKDGPSAGVTIATALVSAISKRAVRAEVGMTGEITLRGRILPIGGLKEKVLAAHRAGLKNVIIPADNEKDVSDIPDNILKKITISFAEHMDELLKIALVGESNENQ